MAIDTDLMKCSKCGEMRVNQAKQQAADDGRAMDTVKEEEEELESSSRTTSSKGDAVLNSATCASCEALDTKDESKPSTDSDTAMATASKTDAIDALKTELNIDLTTTEEMPPPLNEPNSAPDESNVAMDIEPKVKDDEKLEPIAIATSTTPTPTAAPVPESSASGKQSIEEKTETTAPTSPAPPPPPPPPPPQTAPPTSPQSSPERIAAPPPPPPPQLQQRSGKITRSSLNGSTTANRAPTIMKRLRKSTRSTRFKSKLTGRTNLSNERDRSSNGHNGADGAGSYNSANHNQGFPHSNSKSQGKSSAGNNLGGNSGGTSGGGSSFARNRRALFKRPAQKQPKVQATTRFVKSVFYKGSYMQIGDIVSIVDSQQKVYYAQIRGLLVDAYCEKSAFLTWLIPTQDSPDPKEGFDPATYLIGPDEDLSRKLCYLEFVMHAPSNYYFDRSTPFPLPDVDEYTAQRSGGYLWTRLPIIKREKRVNNSNNC
ncbi:pinin [Drosophila tropicalis]|uniref:pinin n=1 Tax=Drosophila tropicalis TaxID=46794 RepID=UPI0035ABE23B